MGSHYTINQDFKHFNIDDDKTGIYKYVHIPAKGRFTILLWPMATINMVFHLSRRIIGSVQWPAKMNVFAYPA